MEKEFYLETYNYKYNSWLPVEIIGKWDDKVIKVRCYVYVNEVVDGETKRVLKETFETGAFWTHIRAIKK